MKISRKYFFILLLLISILSVREYIYKTKTPTLDCTDYLNLYNNKKMLLASNYHKQHPTILMIGDSHTAGNKWNKMIKTQQILNLGVPGDTTLDINDKLPGVYNRLQKLDTNYKKAFIMLGINDIFFAQKPKDIYNSYIKIIKLLQKYHIKVYVQSTLYITNNKYGVNKEKVNKNVAILNKLLYQYATTHNIIFIDLNKLLTFHHTLKTEYTKDGIHLNNKGYKIWAEQIKRFITKDN